MVAAWLIMVPVLFSALVLVFFLVIYFSIPSKRDFVLHRKHAVVTGGSKGIGKQLAMSLLSRGANVSIVARKESDLKAAQEELQAYADSRGQRQQVKWYSCDLTKGYEEVREVLFEAETKLGPIEVLINNAGNSVQAPFDELPIEDYEKQMKLNYLSAVYATRAVVAGMKQRKTGHISFVSSAAGQCAIYGYAAYSPAKFALRGFADAIHMELQPFKIGVSVLYPPNTDTEGFKVELETMPEEVRLISETAGLFKPSEVAERHISDIEAGEYATTIGLDGWMLGSLTAGASPEKNMMRAITQTLLAGLFRGVMLVYIGYFNGIVKKCHRRRLAEKKEREDEAVRQRIQQGDN